MKCPKCGYISFDDLSTCTKCSTDLSAIAEELKGTGTETEPDFFLGSAIKNTNLDFDDTFSSTQTLPPLESDVELDFDDTANTTQGISFSPGTPPPAPADDDLDNTGDVAIELGEIMPIDLSQLDATTEISALASQGRQDATESLPDEATMAVDLADLTSQDLEAATSDLADDSMDLTAQLADLESEDADATMALESIETGADEAEEDLDETIILPDLDQLDVEMAEEEGEAEELSLDDTAAMELDGLEDIDDGLEATADEDEAAPELNLDDIDLSDLVAGGDDAEGPEEEPGEDEEAEALEGIDLDSTAEALDLSALDEVESEEGSDVEAEEDIEDIELPRPENGDEIPLPDLADADADDGQAPPAEDGETSLPDLDVEEGLDFDESGEGDDESIVDLSSLIEEEGVQDEGDATIELDMLSDEPIPQPDADATSELPEIEIDMTPIDEDDDTPPEIPE